MEIGCLIGLVLFKIAFACEKKAEKYFSLIYQTAVYFIINFIFIFPIIIESGKSLLGLIILLPWSVICIFFGIYFPVKSTVDFKSIYKPIIYMLALNLLTSNYVYAHKWQADAEVLNALAVGVQATLVQIPIVIATRIVHKKILAKSETLSEKTDAPTE